MPVPRRRLADQRSEITNADLFDELMRLEQRVAKVETRVGQLFGAIGVTATVLTLIQLITARVS